MLGSNPHRAPRALSALTIGWLFAVLPVVGVLPAAAQAPQWETAANHSGDPLYVQLPYEVVFVATKIVETTTTCFSNTVPLGQYEIGLDVVRATKPSSGNTLWVVTRDGVVEQLFPLPVHETITVIDPDGNSVPLIDTPLGALDKGSVVEPNVSEDGERVIFTYFHDTTFNINSNQGGMSKKGADLYVMDMSALIADPATDPASLPVQRLTFKQYDGTGAQADADKNEHAMNPSVVNNGNNGWGTVYMHGVEMRTAQGLQMVYVSGEKRLMNSNDQRGHTNYNLNLNVARIKANGSLGEPRQFQYYTTTSALSPTPLPEGIAFSYQATTGDGRNWQIQKIDSVGRWGPLIGYGSNPDLFHLGAYCVDTQGDSHGNLPGDYFVATRYYNENNNGYGALYKINLADAGLNTYDDTSTSWGVKPRQKNARKISLFVPGGDQPSGQNGGIWYGKMSSPRCGRPDELLFSHTPTSANGKDCSTDGKHIYHAYIGFRAGFEDFDPTATWTPAGNDGVRVLVDDGNDFYTLAWPVPLLSWLERTGEAQQDFSQSVIARGSVAKPGEPFAQVGTSAIYNTDRRPYDCWLGPGGGEPYNPILLKTQHNKNDQILWNFDGVTKVLPDEQGQPDFCKPLGLPDVLGIQINVTSNRINHLCCSLGYQTDGSGDQETVRQLGVYDVRGQGDGSFQALIPSHVPFEFHLLDAQYGMRLVDVRSWHSLQPRETRTNCGGCHQHVEGLAIPFAGKVADSQPPLDMVTQTQTVSYDPSCNPTLVTSNNPTEPMPEWDPDIWTGFNAYCSSCHTGGGSGTGAFSYSDEATAYAALRDGLWADAISGALGSPAFWAARGERTDGRDDSIYTPVSEGGSYTGSPPYYRFSAIHATDPGLCAAGDPVKAAWVQRLGQWIDNLMPRTTGGNFAAKYDRYHPTVDSAVYGIGCDGSRLRVGFWDDSGELASVEVYENGTLLASWGPNEPNGFRNLTGLSIANNDVIEVIAIDAAGNRQLYEKRGKVLKDECVPKVIQIDPRQPVVP